MAQPSAHDELKRALAGAGDRLEAARRVEGSNSRATLTQGRHAIEEVGAFLSEAELFFRVLLDGARSTSGELVQPDPPLDP